MQFSAPDHRAPRETVCDPTSLRSPTSLSPLPTFSFLFVYRGSLSRQYLRHVLNAILLLPTLPRGARNTGTRSSNEPLERMCRSAFVLSCELYILLIQFRFSVFWLEYCALYVFFFFKKIYS